MGGTLLCALALFGGFKQNEGHPTGLWIEGTHWFYFPTRNLGPEDHPWHCDFQGFLTYRMITPESGWSLNPDGQYYAKWTGRLQVLGDVERFEQTGPEAAGEVWFSPNGPNWNMRLKNASGSIAFSGAMHNVSDTRIDFYTGEWQGTGVELSLAQEENCKITGTAHNGSGEFAIRGLRYGTVAKLGMFDRDTGQQKGVMDLAWAPSDAEVRKMNSTGEIKSNRLIYYRYQRDKKDVSIVELSRKN